jgi:hypothetical protein
VEQGSEKLLFIYRFTLLGRAGGPKEDGENPSPLLSHPTGARQPHPKGGLPSSGRSEQKRRPLSPQRDKRAVVYEIFGKMGVGTGVQIFKGIKLKPQFFPQPTLFGVRRRHMGNLRSGGA